MAVWDVATRPPREQFGYWREVICQAFVPLAPSQLRAVESFRGRVEARPLSEIVCARVASHAQRTIHGPAEVARTDGEYLFVNLQSAGTCAVEQYGRRSLIRAGQLTVLDTTAPFVTEFDGPWDMVSYRIPHQLLGTRLDTLRLQTATCWDTNGVGALVPAVMTAMWQLEDATGPARCEVEQVLIAALTAAAADRAGSATDRQAQLRAAIHREIQRGLFDPDLTVTSVSRRLAISSRSLHAALSASGHTFAATLRRQRLEHAARLLADRRSTATVTQIAASVCFDAPASFARAFHREFGRTPSQVRRMGTAPPARTAPT